MKQAARAEPFTALRPEVWSPIQRRLRQVVNDDPVLRLVHESTLRPLQLLESMAGDAPAALGDDFFAAERLRMLLFLAAPWRMLPAEAAQLAGATSKADAYQPGVLHHGRLVILGLAAIRVAPAAAAADFLATIHGLALALSPIEVLGRLEPGGPDGESLATLLRTLVGLGDVPAHPTPQTLRPFGFDAVERGRWASLFQIFGTEALGHFVRDRLQAEKDGSTLWDGAHADQISAVDPVSGAAGDQIVLRGHFNGPPTSKRTSEPPTSQVVFAAPRDVIIPAEVLRRTKTQLVVVAPRGVATGWIGFSDPTRLATSNKYRKSVRDFWLRLTLPSLPSQPPGFLASLRDAPVPTEVIPDLGGSSASKLSAPPRTAHNRFSVAGTSVASAENSAAATSGDSGAAVARAATAATTAAEATDGDIELPTMTLKVQQDGADPPFIVGAPLRVAVTLKPAPVIDAQLQLLVEGREQGEFLRDVKAETAEVTVDVRKELVKPGPLRITASLFFGEDEFPSVTTSFDAVVLAARIDKVEALQAGQPAPFIADDPVEVLVAFDPGEVEPDVTISFADGTRLTPVKATEREAKFVVPGTRVHANRLSLSVALSLPSDDPKAGQTIDSRRLQFSVRELEFEISDISVTQEGNDSTPFAAGKPVDVVVKTSPDTLNAAITLVIQGQEGAPLAAIQADPGKSSFLIPSGTVIAGTLAFEVQVRASSAPGATIRARQSKNFAVETRVAVEVVLFRPFVLRDEPTSGEDNHDGVTRVSAKDRDELFDKLRQRLMLDIRVHELPWVEDELAVLGSDVVGIDDPRVSRLLEGLSRSAALTPDFESAIWIALVPPPADTDPSTRLNRIALRLDQRLAVHLPAEAALAVAVCNPESIETLLLAAAGRASAPDPALAPSVIGALTPSVIGALAPSAIGARAPSVLRAFTPSAIGALSPSVIGALALSASVELAASSLPLAPPRQAMTRLRVLGRLTPDGVELAAAREEERLAGPGAPYPTNLVAVALDANGRALKQQPIYSVREGDQVSFELLFPVSPDVVALRFMRGAQVLSELRRPSGRPTLSDFGIDANSSRVHWKYEHTEQVRPALELELVRDAGTVAFIADSCADDFRLPAQRLPTGEVSVRLVATDGWNRFVTTAEKISVDHVRLILRRVSSTQWFAETELSGNFNWTLDGLDLKTSDEKRPQGRVLDLQALRVPDLDLRLPNPPLLSASDYVARAIRRRLTPVLEVSAELAEGSVSDAREIRVPAHA